nr:MAG TPA: crystallin beta/gamma motif-containing protein [Caudoviricetes sp.]
MGTFNFSNMQQQEDKMRNVPEEFRGAVEKAASEPVGSYGNNDDNEIDINTGFLDETGTWNSGTIQEMQKYNPTERSAEQLAKDRAFAPIPASNAYKKYFYSREDVLQEAKTISAATHIPENAILSNAENLKNARDIYNYQQRAMDPQAVFKAYPELGELAQKSDTDAAIALHNLKNVRQTQGIIEAAKTGWELDSLMSERGRIGYAAMNGKELTEENLKRLEEIKKQQENAKELPSLFEDPAGAIVGGTVQSGKMMLRNMLSGQKMGVYGAGFGAIVGGLIGGGATLGAGTAPGMAAGAKIGWSIGSRIGMAQDMYDEIAGNNYLDYKNYKDKHGKQLLTDNQARAYAAAAAAVETGIEFTNADKILGIVKGGAGAQSLKNIIANAKDSTELQSLLAAYVRNGMKNIGEVTLTESAEEGVQEMSNRVITKIAASNNPGGDIPMYSAEDVIMGGLEASWQALPTSLGFGASAHAASTVSYARRMAAAMELKSEEDKANLRTANGLSLLRSLGEDLKTNELFKKSPEIYRDILKSQLKGTDLETIHIDTEMVLNQEGGYELLKEVADKAGVSEEQFNNIVETKADMHINVADYAEKVLKYDLGAKLEEYITFDDIGESLARNRQYASRMRREMDKILAFEERQREDALNTYLDNNFPEQEQREIAEAVIRRFPDNPKEGVKVIRQSLQDKIDTPLKEIIEQLKEGAGKGVSIHAVDENGNLTSWENSDHGKGVRVSNNAPWYRKWFKEYGRKPSEKEYRDLARDIYTGHNPYGLEGWENRSAEENQWYEDNKAAMEATEQAIARLDALTPALEKIDPGELTITEGLSEEAFEVYREMRKKLFEGAGGEKLKKKAREKARQEAQLNAILFARMADRMAEWHRQAGQTKYTAKDFARSVGVEFGGRAGEGMGATLKQGFPRYDEMLNPQYVIPINETETEKVNKLADSIEQNGWQGPPLLVIRNNSGDYALTGSHRIAAAIQADEEIPAVVIEDNDATAELLEARDDDERLAVAKKLLDEDEISKDAYELLKYEVEQNESTVLNQKAYHGSGSVFDKFDFGYNQSVGEHAVTANIEKLNEAKRMVQEAEAREEDPDMDVIYKKTGWHLGADGKWRFEIPDNLDKIDLKELTLEGESYLKNIYDNPALYDAYPWLQYVKVTSEDTQIGVRGYSMGEDKIALNKKLVGENPKDARKIMSEAAEDDSGKAAVYRAFKSITEDGKLPDKAVIQQIAKNLPDKYFFDAEPLDVSLSDKAREYSQDEKISALNKQFRDVLKAMQPDEQIKKTLIHEIQHIIQNSEGFATGGNAQHVKQQMQEQYERYLADADKIYRNGGEYVKFIGEYDEAEWQHFLKQLSDEEFKKYEDKLAEYQEDIPEDKRKILEEIKRKRFTLKRQINDAFRDDRDNYLNLHGEQEARLASDKADLYTKGASQNMIDDLVVNGIDAYNAIIVYGGTSFSMDAGQKGLYKIKGQTAFRATGEKVISLFEAADQSTFMHEMAHVYLHDMLALAKLPSAPQQLLDDVKTLNDWASWRPETFDKEYKGTAVEREFKKLHEQIADAQKFGYLKIDGRDVTLEQLKLQWAQERFARGFENYLREGKAPAEAVRTVFQRFKKWLSDIYRAFVQIGSAPSKEVRAVMDRMIASEEEIDIAMTKKGVDDFTEKGGMDYLADNAKQIYNRMVERAKEDAKEKVLKIALKDVKEDYRQQEKEFFEQEEKDYREKLEREPVFVIQEHIKNNPDMSTSAICQTLGMSVDDYVAKLKEYGGSIDAAVQAHMKEFKKNIDNSGFDAQYFREKAEEIVQESRYRKLAATMELNAFEQIAKAQRSINQMAVKNMTLTDDEKGVMGTVDKLTAQSKKIEHLKAEKKEEAAKHREEKEQIIANVRGLRDAALKHYQEFVDYVERKLETMPIGDANNYQMWRRKSAEAQHNSERAIVSGKWELAVKYKRAQVIYDMFADRAVRNDKKIKKIEEQLTKRRQTIIKNKNISANERYAYNHMLYVFGFVDADAPMPPKYQEENGFMGVLQKSDAPREVDGLFLECPFFTPEGFLNLPEWLVSAAMGTQQREQGHKDLSNEQVKMLAQVMNIIYKRGIDDMKLLSIEKGLTADAVIAEIEGQVNQRIVAKTIKDTTGATKKTWDEEAARAINDANQFLIKPEVILKKLGSVSLKYIYEPLKLAADKELRMAHDMQQKMDALFKRYTPEELSEIRNKQKYKFGTSVLTKEQVIMIALNWGTEINAKRVMDGYHVSEYDVRKVLAELTEKDWNLVNDVWKLYDEHWDEVREIEARITGAVLEKQPNREFTIIGNDKKSYTLEGGYFPIKYDPSEMRTQEQKADAAAMQQTAMSNISMSLGKGFLKERSNAKIERRLDLRFDVISRSVADVIHLVAFREPVRDVRRIVLRDDFKNIVTRFLGDAEYKELKKWTADCWAEEPVAHYDIEKAIAKLRNAQTIGVMGYRVVTSALNIANTSIVAHYMGTADMIYALKKFYSAPRQYADFIFQRSVFMAERAETMDASISDAIKEPHFMDGVPVVGKAKKYLRENAFKMLTWTDLMLAMPLWQHEYEKAYNKELEAGHTPQQAQMAGISAGDAAVRWCFGSSRTVDKARVQRKGGEFMKQLTMFYSYMSTVYNAMNYQQWEARMGYKKAVQWADANKSKELLKAIAKMGGWLFAWHLMPAIITALFKAATSGDDDDLKPEKLLKSIGKETLSTMVGGIPVIRDMVPYLLATVFDDKQFAPQLPLYRTVEQTNRVIQSIVNDKKSFTDVLRESGKLISQTTGAPSTLVDALTTSITYLETSFDADVSEYLRALILDKKLKNKK